MSSGLMATIGVIVLVGIFGLIILLDRKKTQQQEAAPKRAAKNHMTPTER